MTTPYTPSKSTRRRRCTDYGKIASYGVLSTPALAVDGQVVLAGRVPPVADLVDLIRSATT